MAKWNDTDTPLAYLITVRSYGTWLHGDERGSIDRSMNKYGSPKIPHRPERRNYNESIMRSGPVYLDAPRRHVVEDAIREVCVYRNWGLPALNVRTNHFHAVTITPGLKPFRALNSFKAYATRRMRAFGLWTSDRLWTEESVANACDYVINGQGCDLNDLETWEALHGYENEEPTR